MPNRNPTVTVTLPASTWEFVRECLLLDLEADYYGEHPEAEASLELAANAIDLQLERNSR